MSTAAGTTWLTVPDLVELLGIPQSKVRRLFDERILLAVRVDGVLKVPADFIVDGEPLGDLRGTLVVLADAGFTDDEAMHWLLERRGEPRHDADRGAARRPQGRGAPGGAGSRVLSASSLARA